ncbi:G-protein coupled receptor 37-like 1 [Lampris incognitus]|uniref:G-protein coupled receptor 37-like 1 n=1 Tax=Lampris incognitus TaxID=2546036 RepID=UPI0024B51F4B|nr:G-protein coupled receptor 37-like 1 [Lampris incognitus]
MVIFLTILLVCARTAELGHVPSGFATPVDDGTALQTPSVRRAGAPQRGEPAFWGTSDGTARVRNAENITQKSDTKPRITRGAEDGSSKIRDKHSPHNYRHPRPYGPDSYFTTPKSARQTDNGLTYSDTMQHSLDKQGTGSFQNPLYPLTDSSYGAYAIMLLALILFAMGIVGNLALMCIVWHNYYLKTAWNSILASLAFSDFLVLFFCLPVVIFNELTTKRLLGNITCMIVPYMEVTSLGVATFSLCALSIDRFHIAVSRGPLQIPQVEPCQSIFSKLSVIWVGSMVLAAPELLLWKHTQVAVSSLTVTQNSSLPAEQIGTQEIQPGNTPRTSISAQTGSLLVDMCVRQPSMDLHEMVYSLMLTYHEARTWWYFGCYFCLPLLFTLACNLMTRHVVAPHSPQKQNGGKATGGHTSSSTSMKRQHAKREHRLSSTVMALAIIYAMCNLPENACNITTAYVSVSMATSALLVLIGQFLLFIRCAVTPVLLLCQCRSLGQAFIDCCCCCCEECLPDGASSSSSFVSTTTTAASTSPSSLSCPTSHSPSSASPSSSKEEKVKIVSGTMSAALCDRPKVSSSMAAIGTPC